MPYAVRLHSGPERRATPRAVRIHSLLSYVTPALLVLGLAACGDAANALVAPEVPPVPVERTTPGTPAPSGASSALAGASLWVDPQSNAHRTADAWRASRPADASQLDKVAAQPQVAWIGDWFSDVRQEVDAEVTTMARAGATPVFVAYNIPQRDCGGLSGGNPTSVSAYRTWVADFAAGIGGRRAVVILEPDALAAMDCLSPADQQTRLALLTFAVQTFRALGGTSVYLDAGNPTWKSAATMADRLTRADVAEAQGFSLNVSNFIGTSANVTYGTQVSGLVGGKHFVIDTGRNGVGATADGQWCNPAGRALGNRPTATTGVPLVDAYLWVKAPGESDGACAGSPTAGTWMPEYALGLAQRASF